MKKYIILIIISLVIMLNFFSYNANELDAYKEILNISHAKIKEVGLEITFRNSDDLNICYANLKESFQFHNPIKNEKIISKTTDYLQFNIDNFNGSIQRIDSNKIKISINQKTEKNNMELLKGITVDAFGDSISEYLYIKSKINDDYHKINDKILKFLDKYGATDIDTISLNNGYSTVCNTHKYNTKTIGNRNFDFQVAIMNYSNESELIIGIPEITVAF